MLHAGWFHDSAGLGRHAGRVKFAFAIGQLFGADGHGLCECVRDDVDDEFAGAPFACGLGVSQRVFFGAVGFVCGAEEERHGIAAHTGEERKRREVELAVEGHGADPGDGAGDDAADHEFVAIGDGEGGGGEFHVKAYFVTWRVGVGLSEKAISPQRREEHKEEVKRVSMRRCLRSAGHGFFVVFVSLS